MGSLIFSGQTYGNQICWWLLYEFLPLFCQYIVIVSFVKWGKKCKVIPPFQKLVQSFVVCGNAQETEFPELTLSFQIQIYFNCTIESNCKLENFTIFWYFAPLWIGELVLSIPNSFLHSRWNSCPVITIEWWVST